MTKQSLAQSESGLKRCAKCLEEVPRHEFSPDARAKDGLQSSCRPCCQKRKSEAYWRNPELARSKERAWKKNNPESAKESDKRQREGKNREKVLERKRQQYRRNRENPDWQERQRKKRRANAEDKRKYDKKYNAENREKKNQQARDWIKNNPEGRRAILVNDAARRRTRKKGGPNARETREWSEKQPKVCYWCGGKCASNYHVDHYQPLAKGGAHELGNLVIACPSCNFRKNAKDPYEFAQEVGRLF